MLPPDKVTHHNIEPILGAARSRQAAEGGITYQKAGGEPQAAESPDMQLRRFRHEVYERLESTPSHYTVESCAVDISEGGFSAMQANADYYTQILGQIRKEFGTSYAPRRVCVHIQVGATIDEYHVHSWASAYAGDYEIYTKHSFYRRTGSAPASPAETGQPSAFEIYRDHLQMQFEKLESRPRHAPQPRQKTQSMYEEMGYENPETENHDFHG